MSNNRDSDETVKDVSRRNFFKRGTSAVSAPVRGLTQKPDEKPAGKKILGRKSGMSRRTFVKVTAGAAAVVGLAVAIPQLKPNSSSNNSVRLNYKGKITPEDRRLAAIRANGLRSAALASGPFASAALLPVPGGIPDYFGPYPNYANSPLPTATVTIPSAGTVTGATISAGGTGYTTPHVTLTGGSGTGATATARVSNGVIIGLVITNPGSGYTSPPTVTFSDPSPRATGATAITTVTPNAPTVGFTGGLQKFVDSLPGLGSGAANNLGQYIPIATPGTLAGHPNEDYYEIELVEYTERMHSGLPANSTRLRGYHQVGSADPPHYLGPIIIAQRNRPVRVKFTNNLPTGAGGNLFIPVDTSYMGAGLGPDGVNSFKQNRAAMHLHGGTTPWISDGTPHQWTTPATETTPYPKGVSVQNVPDMPTPGAGSLTFFYSNQQSARLMFYHDHALGITRLNVYAGEAAGYLLQDPVETALVSGGTITPLAPSTLAPVTVAAGTVPATQIPLIIQDKTFVDPTTISAQDPTWNGPLTLGSLWFPHVYMPNQNPWDITGANPMGRWDYGPWFWPPFTNLTFPDNLGNPYYGAPGEPPRIPNVPNLSGTPESFMDTPIVNGTAYPYLTVAPQAYRFRILNACNDRMLNLQLYQATTIVGRIILTSGGSGYTTLPTVTLTGGGGTGATARGTINSSGNVTALTLVSVGTGYTSNPTVTISPPAGIGGVTATGVAQVYTGTTEVGMVPSVPGIWPAGWGTPDSRDGGWPDPNMRGPAIIQIGTEGGFLPGPALINNVPVDYDYNRRSIVVLNVLEHSLFMAPAERADIIIDFTNFAGKTLILYNDCPAPVPGFDPRLDYYTADPDQSTTGTATGGAPTTLPGYGPNTRTIMQIRVTGTGGTAPPNDYNPATLTALQTALPAAFAASQERIIVPQTPYNSIYGTNISPTNQSQFVRIQDTTHSFNPIGGTGSAVTAITVLNGGIGYTSAPAVTIAPPGGAGTTATATATIAGGGVASITLTNPGTGYATPPTIVFSGGGGGTGATATATVGSSALASVTVVNAGSGYSSAPTVGFTGGGGSGAAATATIGSGALSGITVVNAGSGYTSAPTVNITGGGGTGAIAISTIGSGPVTGFTITNGGLRYSTAPIVTISGGGGTGATATATITGGSVTNIALTNGGTGYTNIPTVTLTGGGGVNAAATAVVPGATHTVTGITVTNPGINFTSVPTVILTGGGGTGATATATVPANAGTVTGITLTSPGTGYTSAPTVTLTGGGGTGATATATALTGGIASIIITNPGSGYNSAPTISFTGGGGSGAAATATVGGTVSALNITNGGSGYSTAPAVTIAPPTGAGVGAAAIASVNLLTLNLQPKAIQELFTTDYGRMNALLGNEVPNTTGVNQTTIIQAYIDPPAELVKFSDSATAIGSAADGTQLWKVTHNGVDTHVIHFHLFNVQLVNRVGWDGAIRAPDDNELGWKESVRMNPLEDAIVALRPIRITTPFAVPDSIRLLDPTRTLGSTMDFNNVDPLGNPVTVTNQLVNFGWEYVYHCHILGHEENDMMRPVCASTGVPPTGAPSTLTGTRAGTTVTLNWSNAGVGNTATNITVERATNAGFTTGLTTIIIPQTLRTALPTSYADTTAPATGALWYRVRASNVVGIVGVGAYPTISSDSTASNVINV